MDAFPKDIFSEPEVDPDTLANLGPLRRLAGEWQGLKGVDVNPKADGPERRVFIDTWSSSRSTGRPTARSFSMA
jgi:hypothetical protein